MFGVLKQFKQFGLVGINKRNAGYTLAYNPRKLYPLVDNKLLTKQLALEAQLSVPELYGVIESPGQMKQLESMLEPYNDFVIKPAQGSGGDGIIVVADRFDCDWQTVSGHLLRLSDLKQHITDILSGVFSLGGMADKAMIEYRVDFDPVFSDISFQGVPDVRIIVFQGVPVMGMVRLPTRASGGKANLHQGAIGVGIDMRSGKTLTGVLSNKIVDIHPDTRNRIVGVQVPQWDKLLSIASGCYDLSGLGYLGVDLVLDKHKGPLILELNARPGLAIQIANRVGLESRLDRAEAAGLSDKSVSERIAFSKNEFANKIIL
ncbi:MAG: alpha-L-glutamate ligase-like protein [Arenicella sp.]